MAIDKRYTKGSGTHWTFSKKSPELTYVADIFQEGKPPVKCYYCGFEGTQYQYKQHIHTCSERKKCKCSDCGETFPEHQFLIEHMKYVHKKIYYSKCLTKDEYLKKNDIKDSENQSKITAVENNADNLKVIDFRCTICPAFVKVRNIWIFSPLVQEVLFSDIIVLSFVVGTDF